MAPAAPQDAPQQVPLDSKTKVNSHMDKGEALDQCNRMFMARCSNWSPLNLQVHQVHQRLWRMCWVVLSRLALLKKKYPSQVLHNRGLTKRGWVGGGITYLQSLLYLGSSQGLYWPLQDFKENHYSKSTGTRVTTALDRGAICSRPFISRIRTLPWSPIREVETRRFRVEWGSESWEEEAGYYYGAHTLSFAELLQPVVAAPQECAKWRE